MATKSETQTIGSASPGGLAGGAAAMDGPRLGVPVGPRHPRNTLWIIGGVALVLASGTTSERAATGTSTLLVKTKRWRFSKTASLQRIWIGSWRDWANSRNWVCLWSALSGSQLMVSQLF
jgi:hypothetical protein